MVRVEVPVDDDGRPSFGQASYGGRSGTPGATRLGQQRKRGTDTSQASMATILVALEKGFSINDACRAAQRSRSAYQYYRDNFPEWRDRVDVTLAQRTEGLAARRE